MNIRHGQYRPSNGAEGADFQARWCEHCEHDADYSDEVPENGCRILADSYNGYVAAWVYDCGKPVCLAFTERKDTDHD